MSIMKSNVFQNCCFWKDSLFYFILFYLICLQIILLCFILCKICYLFVFVFYVLRLICKKNSHTQAIFGFTYQFNSNQASQLLLKLPNCTHLLLVCGTPGKWSYIIINVGIQDNTQDRQVNGRCRLYLEEPNGNQVYNQANSRNTDTPEIELLIILKISSKAVFHTCRHCGSIEDNCIMIIYHNHQRGIRARDE